MVGSLNIIQGTIPKKKKKELENICFDDKFRNSTFKSLEISSKIRRIRACFDELERLSQLLLEKDEFFDPCY